MTRPPTLDQARKRGLLAAEKHGIHTFSNGTAWDCWASGNCLDCWYWDPDQAGALCAFEAAAFLGIVSPELAQLFGWIRNAENAQDGERFGWDAPDECRFFRSRTDDNGDDNPPPPDPDPLQLVLLADPTEDVALLVADRELVEVCA